VVIQEVEESSWGSRGRIERLGVVGKNSSGGGVRFVVRMETENGKEGLGVVLYGEEGEGCEFGEEEVVDEKSSLTNCGKGEVVDSVRWWAGEVIEKVSVLERNWGDGLGKRKLEHQEDFLLKNECLELQCDLGSRLPNQMPDRLPVEVIQPSEKRFHTRHVDQSTAQ
jgi:hypothetical protein